MELTRHAPRDGWSWFDALPAKQMCETWDPHAQVSQWHVRAEARSEKGRELYVFVFR